MWQLAPRRASLLTSTCRLPDRSSQVRRHVLLVRLAVTSSASVQRSFCTVILLIRAIYMAIVSTFLERLFFTAMEVTKQLGVNETFVELLTEYRGWIVLFFVLPISFLVDTVFSIKCRIDAVLNAIYGDSHDDKVRYVQKQVQEWNQHGKGKSLMCTARKPFLTMSTRTADFKSDCAQIEIFLDQILEIDEASMTIRTEPLVNMGQMTAHLLPRGLALAIQVEMEDLTIGGLTMGLGMETSSHRLGLIHETVVAFEIVLSSGELVKVTRDNEHKELFKVLPLSQGSLGFLVAVTLQIVRVKPYVRVQYIPCHSMPEYCDLMRELSQSKDTPYFLEATVYSKGTAVIQCGEFVDAVKAEDKSKINKISLWYKPWYYKHVERALSDLGEFHEIIPTAHYYHRYTRSIFWELEDMIPFGNHPLYRFCFGWLGAPKVSLLKASMTPTIRKEVLYKHVVQDIVIPIKHMKEGMELFHEEFGIYPILVFPIRIYKNEGGFLRSPKNLKNQDYEMFVDLGAYGVPFKVKQKEKWDAIQSLRKMESFTRKVGGYQLLYADTLMTREEFREMYDHTLYDQMRKKYDAVGAFPELYDKIRPERHLFDTKTL